MSIDYKNVGPGEPAYPQESPKLQPGPLEEKGVHSTRTRVATSQPGKSNAILDWLGQGAPEAAGKNLVPIRRPEQRTQNHNHIGPSGPGNSFTPAKPHNTFPANIKPTDVGAKHPPATFQPLGAATTQPAMPTSAGHPAAPVIPPNPVPPWNGPHRMPLKNSQQIPLSKSTAFDAVHDPSNPSKKDVIFKVSIPIEEDFQASLDEFCRLRRLGRFQDAEQHFQRKLSHLQSMPYVLVHYCEMLLAAGRYTSYRAVLYRNKYPSSESEEPFRDPSLDMLEANFLLLDHLAKAPGLNDGRNIFEAIHGMLGRLRLESTMGSTAIQILVLCLTILGRLGNSLGESVTLHIIQVFFLFFDWNRLYHRLLGENRIWDLKDLLVAAVSCFGKQFLSRCLGVKSFSMALDRLFEDWIQPEYDEATSLGLLDLFTSLLLGRWSLINDEPKATLLLEHSKSLAESIEANDTENMRSRPFIQWIIAKAIFETNLMMRHDRSKTRELSGITILPGPGVSLPVYMPAEPWDKPHWDIFTVRSSPQQRQTLRVALQAARFLGDYNLQVICLKVLIILSHEPTVLMDSLTSLQFEQEDDEGFLETCLSKYIAFNNEDEAARVALINDFNKLFTLIPENPHLAQTGEHTPPSFHEPNALLLWVRDVIRRLIMVRHPKHGDEENTFLRNNVEFWNGQLMKYGSRLPPDMAEMIQKKFGVRMPPPIQIPLPPVPAQAPPPQGPPIIPGDPGFIKLPPKPQIPPGGQVGHPGNKVDASGLSQPAHPSVARQTVHGAQSHKVSSSGVGVKGDFVTISQNNDKEKKKYTNHRRHSGSRQRPGGRTAAIHAGSSETNSSDDFSETDFHTASSEGSSEAGRGARYYGHRRQKKNGRARFTKCKDLSEQDIDEDRAYLSPQSWGSDWSDYDDTSLGFPEYPGKEIGYWDSSTSPDIKVSRKGIKQILKIVSDVSEQDNISVVITDKADPTKSKVYTARNGMIVVPVKDAVDSDTPGGHGRGSATVDGSGSRLRAKSQSSQQTVRSLEASKPKNRSVNVSFAGVSPSTTLREEEVEATDSDKPSMLRAHKLPKHRDRKVEKWVKEQNRNDRVASSSKTWRPSITETVKPVMPPPGSLVHVPSTDEEDGHEERTEMGEKKERRRSQQKSQPSKRQTRDHHFVISEDARLESTEVVQPSDTAFASLDSEVETTGGGGSMRDRKGKRPADDIRLEHGYGHGDERGSFDSRPDDTHYGRRRDGTPTTTTTASTMKGKKPDTGGGGGAAATGQERQVDDGKRVDTRGDEDDDGEKQTRRRSRRAAVEEDDGEEAD